MTLKKIKRIDAKATTYYTSLIIDNKWNEHNSGSACSCWNCGAHDHRLQKCEVTNNQDQIYANKNNWEEENDKNSGGGGNYERRKFEGGNRYNFPIKNCGTNEDAYGAELSGVELKNSLWLMNFKKTNGNGQKYG